MSRTEHEHTKRNGSASSLNSVRLPDSRDNRTNPHIRSGTPASLHFLLSSLIFSQKILWIYCSATNFSVRKLYIWRKLTSVFHVATSQVPACCSNINIVPLPPRPMPRLFSSFHFGTEVHWWSCTASSGSGPGSGMQHDAVDQRRVVGRGTYPSGDMYNESLIAWGFNALNACRLNGKESALRRIGVMWVCIQ